MAGVFTSSGAAPRSLFTVKTSKVSGKHINLGENKNTSVIFGRQNAQGVFIKYPKSLQPVTTQQNAALSLRRAH